MPLSDMDKQRLTAAAREAGLDPARVIREGESMRASTVPTNDEPLSDDEGHPIAERMLIGFIPYVTVKEFRTIWLKLDEPVPDWELMTGEWLNLHGESVTTAAEPEPPEGDE